MPVQRLQKVHGKWLTKNELQHESALGRVILYADEPLPRHHLTQNCEFNPYSTPTSSQFHPNLSIYQIYRIQSFQTQPTKFSIASPSPSIIRSRKDEPKLLAGMKERTQKNNKTERNVRKENSESEK